MTWVPYVHCDYKCQDSEVDDLHRRETKTCFSSTKLPHSFSPMVMLHPTLFVTQSCLSWPQLATQRARGPKVVPKRHRHKTTPPPVTFPIPGDHLSKQTSRYVDFMASFIHIQVTNSRYIRQHIVQKHCKK